MTLGRNSAARALASLAAITLASACLVACGTSTPSAPTAAGSDLRIAIPTVAPPYSGSSQAIDAMRITSNIFDPLIVRNQTTGKLTPGLATAWKQVSPTVTDLTIRRGVTFQDGTPMTADDVAFTLSSQRLWGPKAIEPSALASTFSGVVVKNADTVEITTAQPDPALLDRLASQIGFVVPKAYLEKVGLQQFGVHPIGTGPYQSQSVQPGQEVVLTANKNYWGPKPTYQTLTFKQVSDVTARISGLATGQYDIATSIPPDQSQQVKSNGQLLVSTPVNNVLQLAFMTNQLGKPTSDPKVRRAMLLAVDRQGIAASLWNGQATVYDGFNLPAFDGFYNRAIPVAQQNLAEAKSLLASAGYHGQPIDLQYIGNYYPNLDQALQVMLPMWKQAGLNVTLDPVANYTLLNYKKLNAYATSSNLQLGNDPTSPIYTDWLSSKATFVKSGRYVPSAAMSEAGTVLATSTNQAERAKAFDTIARLWTTEVPSIDIWRPVEIDGVRDGVHFTPDPRYWMRFAPLPGS
ncbi:ABC transporter substrate-binding protein [Amycolatopsis sp. CA-161197]|uniref:ABC transporter substrate-binding protein n=1 Tax=Amycolatopsis sp. CA-161197 TaxID=3239922 RepID=UPI003D910597